MATIRDIFKNLIKNIQALTNKLLDFNFSISNIKKIFFIILIIFIAFLIFWFALFLPVELIIKEKIVLGMAFVYYVLITYPLVFFFRKTKNKVLKIRKEIK